MHSETCATRSAGASGLLGLAALMVAATMTGAQTPTQRLAIVLRGEGDARTESVLGIVDPAAGRIVGRVPIGMDPHNVAVSPDGDLAFVANTNSHNKRIQDGDSLSVIDLAAGKEVRRIEVGDGSRPNDIKVAGGKVYFTLQGSKAIGRYDPVRNKVDYFGVGQGGPHMLTVSRDGSTIFASNTNTFNVAVLENVSAPPLDKLPPEPWGYPYNWNATLWSLSLIPLGNTTPEAIEFSPNGREVWTANSGKETGSRGGDISIITVATKTAETVDLHTQHANRLRFTPDGKQVLILERGKTSDMLVVDAASRQVVKRIEFPADKPGETPSLGNLTVAADGSHAYIAVNPRGGHASVAVVDLRTLQLAGRFDLETTLSADGLAWVTRK